jgi:glutamine amidotransferase
LTLRKQDPFLAGIEPGSFVYFVHSYYVDPESPDVILASTDHGIEFAAIVHKDNLWATQFHPEKSQKVGERLLDNFGRL